MNSTKQQEWNKFYLVQAVAYSSKSKDPSTKTGCVIVNEDNTPVAWGYNGLSKTMDGELEDRIMNDRENKYERVIHAEENAILNASHSLKNATAYITHPPCLKCSHRLSQAGITHVVSITPSDSFNSRWNKDSTLIELNSLKMTHQFYEKEDLEEVMGEVLKSFSKLEDQS